MRLGETLSDVDGHDYNFFLPWMKAHKKAAGTMSCRYWKQRMFGIRAKVNSFWLRLFGQGDVVLVV